MSSDPGQARREQAAAVVDIRLRRALGAVRAEPARAWTVRDLAKVAGASRAALVRLFHAGLGTSPKRWLTRQRLEHAAQLLAGTDQTLVQIAGSVGYTSEFALSRAFKRQFGLPPAAYRRAFSATPLRCAA